MKNLIPIFYRLLVSVIFLFALSIIFVYLATISYGFYFTGDTITYFVPAYPGKIGDLLSVFAWHMVNYPPFISFILNLLRFLPFSYITQHHIYLIMSVLLSILTTYLIVKKITPIKKWQIILTALLLLIGSNSLMFLLALAEPFFILLWLLAIFEVERFISTKKERYLVLFIFTAGIIPLVKLQGVFLLLGFEIIISVFTFLTYRQKKYSPLLVSTCLLIVWLPIFISSIMNYLLHQSFFGYFDPQTDLTQKKLSYQLTFIIYEVSRDSTLLLLSGLIIGTQIKLNHQLKNFAIIASLTTLTYFFFVALGMTKIRANETLHLRYLLPVYPGLILFSVYVGSVIVNKYPKLRNKAAFSLVFVVIFFGCSLASSLNHLNYEIKSSQSYLKKWVEGTGAEHSADIRRFCRGKTKNKYLLLKESSRNWIAQSLGYYCQPIQLIQMEKQTVIHLPKKSLIYTPYNVHNPKIKIIDLYQGTQEVNLYQAEEDVEFNVSEVFKDLKFLD